MSIRKAPKAESHTDFFVPTLYDVGTKDSRSIMDVAVFRLSKRDRRAGEVIHYEISPGGIEEPLVDALGSRFKAFGDLIDGFWGRF
ncbi:MULTISPECIES: hypothetical protein [Gluconobacter]|uniref:hypothetical protein n=1 Tax=Gluconobacter TaxID=441 RepID=UPI000A36080D|nr:MULTISPECIES: hypothetical protein [Gluconobacter]OUJ08213.1 hypothetical protein HK24_02655 [Gluconobacter sp. DsW_058]